MEIKQYNISLKPRRRGFHLVTDEILEHLKYLPDKGLIHILIKHTSAGLTLNENADSDVRTDMDTIFDKLVPERQPYYIHTLEGDDDMPAHAKTVLCGAELTIPISGGMPALGTWQGIYLCEFRNHGGARKLIVTVLG